MTAVNQPALAFEQAELSVPSRRRAGIRRVGTERINWSATTVLILCAVTVLLPLYVSITMALKTGAQVVDGNAFSFPTPISFDGFVQAWTLTKFPVGLAISFLVTAGTVAATIVLAAFASYAIARNWTANSSGIRSSICSRRCSSRSPSSLCRRSS